LVAVYLIYFGLAEMPGVARDSIRNEGIREINYGIVAKYWTQNGPQKKRPRCIATVERER
jgi:hypothetical protein